MSHDFVPGNRVTLLPDGVQTFEAALDAIASARERVWLECFIFEPDAAGMRMVEALTEAAERGIDVILLIDRFGSRNMRDRHLKAFRRAGGVAVWFNTLLGLKSTGQKITAFGMHRDHRKIFVVDDYLAFTGGRNVSMDYGGPGDDVFYDVMVQIEGPAVRDLAAVFLETLGDASNLERSLFPTPPTLGQVPVRVLQLDLREHVSELDDAFAELLATAEQQILFSTPYFLPTRDIREGLESAAQRGVDVRILTAGRSDVPIAKTAGRHLFRELLDAGIRIFEMKSHPLHAKFIVADGRRCIVGSYNADRWGQRYNQEVAVEVKDPLLCDRLSYCFAEGAQHEVTHDVIDAWSPLRRGIQSALYGISKVIAPSRST